MMQLVFTHVPAAGFTAFDTELLAGEWGLVDTTGYEGTNHSAAQPLGDAPTLVVFKLRLKWGIATLFEAIEGAGGAKAKDRKWDSSQKLLNAVLDVAARSSDENTRDAANRLQTSLLMGAGEEQTRLRYQQEVDFARKQLSIVSQGQGAADAALIGLGPVMVQIAAATNDLAAAIGYGDGADAPYRRKAKATMACATTFAVVADMLGHMAEHGKPGADRERAIALRTPLEDLVARYPARVAAVKPEQPHPPTP